ncbi:hypothetical protein EDB81DRAFT_462999 [Dactylonectria macrodidyma]|uniref:Uncharacterized protein n=1 Tax=Dactylonectria macrodidyma TaxID=307937 RepID=A0A9P9EY81_9HYPO|nr:hypothetical protein EDB81DRAFT_462999 [Dactylonectria macrodidyma]
MALVMCDASVCVMTVVVVNIMTYEWPTDAGRMSASHTPQPTRRTRCHHHCYPSVAAATFQMLRPDYRLKIQSTCRRTQVMVMDSIHQCGLFLLPSSQNQGAQYTSKGPGSSMREPAGQLRWLPAGTWMHSMVSTRGLRCIMILVVQVCPSQLSFNKLRQPTTRKHRPRVTRPMFNAPVAIDHGINKTQDSFTRRGKRCPASPIITRLALSHQPLPHPTLGGRSGHASYTVAGMSLEGVD